MMSAAQIFCVEDGEDVDLISKQPAHNGSNRVGAGGTNTRSSTARNSHTFHTRAPAAPLSTIASPKMIALTHQLPVIRIPVNSVRLHKSDSFTEPATVSGGFIKVSVSSTGDFAIVAGTERVQQVFDLSTGLVVSKHHSIAAAHTYTYTYARDISPTLIRSPPLYLTLLHQH
ncbi:hypothetical protein SeLEV6574_g03474 [Synchytrium endobioticum]|uniref:Uncharacterized protein n=1 Tax=Synchytrium endobioticum TaxID=286115 RepID=A0A507D3Y8_9FUNG|nr:hypothetical protein SeLEV6574_g03474 [Synchytrium endobioticum]